MFLYYHSCLRTANRGESVVCNRPPTQSALSWSSQYYYMLCKHRGAVIHSPFWYTLSAPSCRMFRVLCLVNECNMFLTKYLITRIHSHTIHTTYVNLSKRPLDYMVSCGKSLSSRIFANLMSGNPTTCSWMSCTLV